MVGFSAFWLSLSTTADYIAVVSCALSIMANIFFAIRWINQRTKVDSLIIGSWTSELRYVNEYSNRIKPETIFRFTLIVSKHDTQRCSGYMHYEFYEGDKLIKQGLNKLSDSPRHRRVLPNQDFRLKFHRVFHKQEGRWWGPQNFEYVLCCRTKSLFKSSSIQVTCTDRDGVPLEGTLVKH
jgi:hypothetical protein